MKLSELLQKTDDIRNGSTLREVNAIYMANREEFETTTVCDQNGRVRYVRGKPIEKPERRDGEEISPGVFWRKEGGLGPRPDLPEWKIRNNRRKAEANERAMLRSYPV